MDRTGYAQAQLHNKRDKLFQAKPTVRARGSRSGSYAKGFIGLASEGGEWRRIADAIMRVLDPNRGEI